MCMAIFAALEKERVDGQNTSAYLARVSLRPVALLAEAAGFYLVKSSSSCCGSGLSYILSVNALRTRRFISALQAGASFKHWFAKGNRLPLSSTAVNARASRLSDLEI